MPLSHQQLAGPGYIILNVIRVLNIISLICVITASVVMLVKTFVVSKFFFFDAVSNVITSFVSMFLIVSELSVFQAWYARNWPVLAPGHGFVSLGVAMMVLGVNMLGNLNKVNKNVSIQESLGLAFWRIVIASGILVTTMGFFNIIASYVFRDRRRNITARAVRAHGAIATPTPTTTQGPIKRSLSINTDLPPPVSMSPSVYSSQKDRSTLRSPLKAFTPLRDTFRRARDSILPSYYSRSPYPNDSPTKTKRDSVGPRMPINISAPLNVNPQYAHLIKPDLAHHPSTKKEHDMGIAF